MTASEDASTAKSRSGHAITCAGCPVLWISKLQTNAALSTTEAECIALSQSLRDKITVMKLTREIKERVYKARSNTPKVTCEFFEDNEGAMEVAIFTKMKPKNNHINQMHHHFRS